MSTWPKGIAPLCHIGRPPGTAPPETSSRGPTREANREDWEGDVLHALATVARARTLSGKPLPTAALLSVLNACSTKAVPPIGKRQWLQNRGLIVPLGDGTWDVSETGLTAATNAAPFLNDEAIRAILART